MCDELSWSHYRTLLSISDEQEIDYYILICKEQNLSIRKLQEKIKLKEYKRLPEITKNKLIYKEKTNIIDFVKNPILIKNYNNYNIISEKVLQKLILEDISLFLKEL